MDKKVRRLAFLVLIAACAAGTGCTTVQPWERGRLASARMAWEPDPLSAAYAEHVRFSKEASSGGLSASGGGCGCN